MRKLIAMTFGVVTIVASSLALVGFGGESTAGFTPLNAVDLSIAVGQTPKCENGKTSKVQEDCASTELRCEAKTDKVTFEVQAGGDLKIVSGSGSATFDYNYSIGCTNTANYIGLCNKEDAMVASPNSQGNVISWVDVPCDGTHKVGTCVEVPITVAISVPIPAALQKGTPKKTSYDITIPGAKNCNADPNAQTQRCPAGSGATKSKEQNKCSS